MTEKQALAEGLNYTGYYSSRDPDKVKERAAEIRKLGFRAVVVSKPGERGISVYADEAYEKARSARHAWLQAKNQVENGTVEKRVGELKAEIEKLESLIKENQNILSLGEPADIR